MNNKKHPVGMLIVGFFIIFLVQFRYIFIPGIIFIILGLHFDICLHIGLLLLTVDVILTIIAQSNIINTLNNDSDNPDFSEFQKIISKDYSSKDVINFVNQKIKNYNDSDVVNSFSCYNYNSEWLLVEMEIDLPSSQINWQEVYVPDENLKKSQWQCPYMEQYLNKDGTEKICKTFEVPQNDDSSSRIVFFIYKTNNSILQTPYGDFNLNSEEKLPLRLKNIVEFKED